MSTTTLAPQVSRSIDPSAAECSTSQARLGSIAPEGPRSRLAAPACPRPRRETRSRRRRVSRWELRGPAKGGSRVVRAWPSGPPGPDVRSGRTGRRMTSGTCDAGKPLRLTHRGRVLVVLAGVLALLGAFTVGRASLAAAPDASSPPAHPAATVVVQPGQTLWDVAAAVAPGGDRRVTVERILRMNRLANSALSPGRTLRVPGPR